MGIGDEVDLVGGWSHGVRRVVWRWIGEDVGSVLCCRSVGWKKTHIDVIVNKVGVGEGGRRRH